MKKRILPLTLALALCLGLAVTAQAAPQSSYTSSSGFTVNVTPAPAALADSEHYGEGIFVADKYENGAYTYTFYDVNGNKLGTGSGYELKGKFRNGLAPVSAYDPYTAQTAYGYINKTGALAIPVRFQYADDFSDGIARVRLGENDIYIDTTGVGITNRGFFYMSDFKDGIAVGQIRETQGAGPYVETSRHYIIIDKSGNIVYDFPQRKMILDEENGWWNMSDTLTPTGNYVAWDMIRQGQIMVRDEEEKLYLMDKTGALRPLPDLKGGKIIAYLGNDRLLVENNNMRAIFSMDGAMLMPYLYNYTELDDHTFDHGVAVVRVQGSSQRCGIIDTNGEFVVPLDWSGGSSHIGRPVDGMSIGSYWDYTGGATKNVYLFWASDCPYAPGAAQKPQPPAQPTTPPQPEQPKNLAYASTQTVTVDGTPVEFQMYALKDANGNDTNYVKARDVASVLSGTAARFNVSWDGAVNLAPGEAYVPNGSEMKTPFSGNRAYTVPTAQTKVGGTAAGLDAIVLTDGSGGGFTYYKLRDLGEALGFTVDWNAEAGVLIQTQ